MDWRAIMFPLPCSRCGKDIISVSDYGGYTVSESKDLCKECWNKWIAIRIRHSTEIRIFWNKKGEEDNE